MHRTCHSRPNAATGAGRAGFARDGGWLRSFGSASVPTGLSTLSIRNRRTAMRRSVGDSYDAFLKNLALRNYQRGTFYCLDRPQKRKRPSSQHPVRMQMFLRTPHSVRHADLVAAGLLGHAC